MNMIDFEIVYNRTRTLLSHQFSKLLPLPAMRWMVYFLSFGKLCNLKQPWYQDRSDIFKPHLANPDWILDETLCQVALQLTEKEPHQPEVFEDVFHLMARPGRFLDLTRKMCEREWIVQILAYTQPTQSNFVQLFKFLGFVSVGNEYSKDPSGLKTLSEVASFYYTGDDANILLTELDKIQGIK